MAELRPGPAREPFHALIVRYLLSSLKQHIHMNYVFFPQSKILRRSFSFSFFKKKSFIYFNLAALGLSCCMWDLAPCPGIEPRPPALGAQSLSHWTTREVPGGLFLTVERKR